MQPRTKTHHVLHFCKHHIILRSLRLLVKSIPLLAFLAIVVSLFLAFAGVPEPLVKRWVQTLESQGIHVQVDSMSFNVLRGLSARGFKYFNSRKHPVPVIEAERVRLDLNMLKLVRGSVALEGLRVQDGMIRIGPESETFGPMVGELLVFTDADLDLRMGEEGAIRVDEITAVCLNVNLRGKGVLHTRRAGPAVEQSTPVGAPSGVQSTLEKRPPWFSDLIQQLNAMQFEGAPELNIDFNLVAHDWIQSRVRLLGRGGKSKVRGIRLDSWELDAELEQNTLVLHQVEAQEESNRFQMQGRWNLDEHLLEGAMNSSLPASHWLSLMPADWRDALQDGGLFFEGPVDGAISFGPAPVSNLFTRCSGTVSVHRVQAKGVWVEQADFDFSTDETRVVVRDIDAVVGQEEQQGTVDANFVLDLESGVYTGAVESHIDFLVLLPILSTGLTKLVRNATFPEEHSRALLQFRGARGQANSLGVWGDINATNFVWRGSHVSRFDAGLLVTNRITTLDPFLAVREEGRVEGSLVVDAADKRVDLDLFTSVHPRAAGRAAGPLLDRVLGTFRFEGPATATVAGVVHFGTNGITRLSADVEARQAGYKWFLSDEADFHVVVSNDLVAVRDLNCSIYGGSLKGWFDTFRIDGVTNRAYALDLTADDVDFSQLVTSIKQTEGDPYKGRLSGQLGLKGLMGREQSVSVVGDGTVRVTRGYLLQIPLFGGLSKQLSKVISGLGFATQNDFKADVTILNRIIHTDSAKISGSVLSLEARGDYHFDHTLDYDVKLKLLRDKTSVGKAVQLVTSPISWLLEFYLEGTLSDPTWRPKSLPKELFDWEKKDKNE